MGKIIHFVYCPFTGLGLYNGFRGNRWLKNRIAVFKQFTLNSLKAQTNKNFVLWISWRYEERTNPLVLEFKKFLDQITEFKTVFTYSGVCFWDDKYSDEVARTRLIDSLHGSIGELSDTIGEVQEVLMTIQPSDDCYHSETIDELQQTFAEEDYQVAGFTKGYIINYQTKEVAEYNPTTIPPFFTIRFPVKIFNDPLKHAEYIGPYKSHEYIVDKLKFLKSEERGFVVGCHGENISTHFNNPFKGSPVDQEVLKDFGLYEIEPIKLSYSFRKALLRKLPFKVQRKLRYILGEMIWQRIYNCLRN